MAWEIEYTDEFGDWWATLTETEQEDVDAYVQRLEARGPNLPYPHSSGINGSRHDHMRELRVQSHGKPFRVFYAFDPRRTAILLIGGDGCRPRPRNAPAPSPRCLRAKWPWPSCAAP